MSALLSSLPAQVVAGLILVGLACAVRAFTTNRVVRGRVRLTMVLGVLFVGINAVLAASDVVRPEMRPLVVSVSQLLFAYALIHFVVLVLVNPLRADRVPDYFPTIVQDVLVFVLFAMVATLVMEEKFLTTSAVGAVVAGLALQDTLGNLVSGWRSRWRSRSTSGTGSARGAGKARSSRSRGVRRSCGRVMATR